MNARIQPYAAAIPHVRIRVAAIFAPAIVVMSILEEVWCQAVTVCSTTASMETITALTRASTPEVDSLVLVMMSLQCNLMESHVNQYVNVTIQHIAMPSEFATKIRH